MAAVGGGEWVITAVYTDSRGVRHRKADIELRWSDSFATGKWHPAHLGHTLQLALMEAKKRALPRWKSENPYWRDR